MSANSTVTWRRSAWLSRGHSGAGAEAGGSWARGGPRRRHQLAPVAERQAELGEVQVAELGQDLEIDIVPRQQLEMLSEANTVKKLFEIDHVRPSAA